MSSCPKSYLKHCVLSSVLSLYAFFGQFSASLKGSKHDSLPRARKRRDADPSSRYSLRLLAWRKEEFRGVSDMQGRRKWM